MDIRYTLSLDDFWQFQKYHLRRRLRPAIVYSFIALLALISIVNVYFGIRKWLDRGIIDYLSLFTPVAFILYSWLWKTFLMKRMKSSVGYGDEVYLKMEEQYLMTTTRTRETKLAWSAIHEVVNAKDYIYIFISKTAAVIVPKRALPDEAAANAFFAAATAYRQNAVPGLALNEHTDTTSWPPTPRISH